MTTEPQPLHTFEFFSDSWVNPDSWGEDPQSQSTPIRPENLTIPAPQARRFRSHRSFETKPADIDEDWDQSDLDWGLIKTLRVAATSQISEERAEHPNWTETEEHALGRRVIAELVDRWISEEMRQGHKVDPSLEPRLRKAVFDALFGLGRLQPLIDSQHIENIEIHGCDTVHIELKDGTLVDGPPIADSDEELIQDLQFWASRSKANPRPFSPSTPRMNLPLGETARLAAMAWVTLRPMVTIRLHGMVEVTFNDLVERDTLSPLMANFLTAVVRSGASIVVSGAQGAGKTTLCRALCAALPPSERIITFETDRELHLEKMPDKHPRVFGVEARQGSGEFRPDGREAGVFEIIEALREALRHNADRLLVGEVRGGEIIAMIQAMQSGTGSISTTHARSARDTYNKLVTCCLEVEGISEAYANRAIASAINFVAFIKKVNVAAPGQPPRRVRRVTEVVAIELTADGVAFTDIFTTRNGITRPYTLPPSSFLDDLMEADFDYDAFVQESQR